MLTKILKHKWFIISIFFAVLLVFFRFDKGEIQQDNYIGYAEYLPSDVSNISFYDSRLLPGLPILIYLLHIITGNYYIAGYLLILASVVACYFLLYKLTKSTLSFLPLIFPPIMLNLASLIDTEFPFIFFAILTCYLFKKVSLKWGFLILGLSVWFRLVGFAVLGGVFIYMLLKKRIKVFFLNLPYFLIPVLLLCLYNIHYFGAQNPFYQLITYEALHPGRISVGFIQLIQDLTRAFRWGWYRILVSGIFYIFIFVYLFFKACKTKDLEFWIITSIYLFTLSVNLVPFLENLGRYLAPTLPFFWIIFYFRLKKLKFLYLAIPLSALIVLL